MFPEPISAYDIGAQERESRRRQAQNLAQRLVPTPREGNAYDLNHVAIVTRACNERQRIVRRLTGVR